MFDSIDFEKFSIKELIALNHKLVSHIRFREKNECITEMAKFNPGDKVYFEDEEGETIRGVVVRINQKSITLHTDDHRKWRVSPQLLRKQKTRNKIPSLKILQ